MSGAAGPSPARRLRLVSPRTPLRQRRPNGARAFVRVSVRSNRSLQEDQQSGNSGQVTPFSCLTDAGGSGAAWRRGFRSGIRSCLGGIAGLALASVLFVLLLLLRNLALALFKGVVGLCQADISVIRGAPVYAPGLRSHLTLIYEQGPRAGSGWAPGFSWGRRRWSQALGRQRGLIGGTWSARIAVRACRSFRRARRSRTGRSVCPR